MFDDYDVLNATGREFAKLISDLILQSAHFTYRKRLFHETVATAFPRGGRP